MLITEVKHHLNKATETYRCEVMLRGAGQLVITYRTDRDWEVGGIAIPKGSVTIAHYWPDRGYVLWEMLGPEGALLGHLVHICTPPVIGEETVEYTDLILDVWFRPDGSHRVLDADELEQARAHGLVSDEGAARIAAEGQRVIAEWPHLLAEAALPAGAEQGSE